MTLFNLESLINTPTWFQFEKSRCIDLILTNKKSSFKISKTFQVKISYHHLIVLASMKSQYIQGNPKMKRKPFCVNLLRKTKEHFENISVKDIKDNKKFWKTIKPFFSNKGLNTNKLMLIEDNNLISEESIPANTMNQYFTSITN